MNSRQLFMLKAFVIIPTYNELNNLESLVEQILVQSEVLHILIVDDNSPDGTGLLAERLAKRYDKVHVMHRPAKLGLGSAYREGFRYAMGLGADLLIEMDADFSHDPVTLPKFIEKSADSDLVIGSRYLNGISVVNWPLRRLMLSYGANWYTRMITGLKIKDCTSGFKCFRRNLIESIDLDQIRSDGYSFQIEMNFHAHSLGAKICELPIIFIDRRSGQSKMSRRIVLEAVFMVWKLKIKSLFSSKKRLNNV